MLCKYGCGLKAAYKDRCNVAWSKCKALKEKNSKALKRAHSVGSFDGVQTKESRAKQAASLKAFHDRRLKNVKYEFLSETRRREILLSDQNGRCNRCELSHWMDEKIPLSLHHKDGNKTNSSRKNEELLCFNCHAQTDNFGFKNKKHTQESRSKMGRKLAYSETAITTASEAVI